MKLQGWFVKNRVVIIHKTLQTHRQFAKHFWLKKNQRTLSGRHAFCEESGRHYMFSFWVKPYSLLLVVV